MRAVHIAAVAATVLGVGTLGYVLHRRRSTAPRRTNPGGSLPPRPDEPTEGWQTRWEARRRSVLELCRADVEVQTVRQALTCALNAAFPEAAPWISPGTWTPWMSDAADVVESDLLSQGRTVEPKTHWETLIWLRGQREVARCRLRVVPGSPSRLVAWCAARQIFPSSVWGNDLEPWQLGALASLRTLAAQQGGGA